MKKIVFILFISFLISQICFGNSNNLEQQDRLGVSIIGSHLQRERNDVYTATFVTPNNLPLACTDTHVYGTVPVTLTLSSLDEVYIWDGSGTNPSWIADSWGVTSPHSFSATFNTSSYTIPTGPTTLYASKYGVFDVVADFMVDNSVPDISSLWPPSADRGTTANTWVYTNATGTLVTDETPFGLVKDGDFVTATGWSTGDVTATGWSTGDSRVCYQVTTTLPETMVTGDWLFYMIFNQDDFRYNISKTFTITDSIGVDDEGQPNTVVHSILDNCFPNPVTVGENITFNFMIGGLEGTMRPVSLNIYNIKGELVKEIINDDMMVNDYTETWSVDDMASGVYLYQLKTENYTETKKLLIQ
jgi:hypothetical protein